MSESRPGASSGFALQLRMPVTEIVAGYSRGGMTNHRLLNEEDLQVARLRQDICEKLPNGREGVNTPHELLSGQTPEQQHLAGDVEAVRNVFASLVYIGISCIPPMRHGLRAC